jgi:undecaprenyl-diphosphatase
MVGQFEQDLFLAINHAASPFLDKVMVLISENWTWVPLYGLLLFFIWKYYKIRTLEIAAYIGLLILLCDQISVFIKYFTTRLRPCHEPSFQYLVRLVDGCGGKYGLVSSHAANSMGLAVFILLLFSKFPIKWQWGLLVYTLLIGYSRIYLGVHYPTDILGGYLLGTAIALLLYATTRNRFEVVNS